MSTSQSGAGADYPLPEISIHERAMRFESAFFRTQDALSRARDAWSITHVDETKWDYVHKQLLRAADSIHEANAEFMQLANAVDDACEDFEKQIDDNPIRKIVKAAAEADKAKGGEA